MDEIELDVLSGIPAQALSLRLPRSTIKMRHAASWRVDKWNEVHDLIVCLRGSAHYLLDDHDVTLHPGEGMLIPAGSRFVGRIGAGESSYTGIAQHFALDLFGDVDLIAQMEFARVAPLPDWERMEHLVRLYRDMSPAASTTLAQHHLFLVILLAFLSSAFRGWRAGAVDPIGGQDTLSLHIVLAASRIAADPGGEEALGAVLGRVPFNGDYFRRAFRDKIGMTPRKFMEFKRMEKARNMLATGQRVKETAAKLGYSDAYYFSRMFRRHMGASPARYRLRARSEVS
jgi:AraC-like DNA-binding protein